jgi:hypothetical protein
VSIRKQTAKVRDLRIQLSLLFLDIAASTISLVSLGVGILTTFCHENGLGTSPMPTYDRCLIALSGESDHQPP